MSTAGSALMACPDVQAELNGLFINCDPATIGFRSPFFEFLWSPLNRKGIQQILNPGPGKKRTVQLRYDQAIPLTDVVEGDINDITCQATTKRGDLTSSYELPDVIQYIEESFDVFDFENICRNQDQAIARKMNLMMKALREKTAKVTADQFVSDTLWGTWSSVTGAQYSVIANELIVKTLKTGSTEDPYYKTLQDIDGALMMSQYCENPVIFGGFTLFDYYNVMRSGCCATNGVDLSQQLAQHQMAIVWDKWLQTALGSNNISVAVMPGALQLLYYNPLEGRAPIMGALNSRSRNYDNFTLTDPVTGMPVNVQVSDNCGAFSIFMWTQTKLIAMPNDLFSPADPNGMSGVRFVNKIRVTNT